MEYLYLGDGAGESLRFDIVADLVGLEEQYEHSSGKVLEGAAQRHADGYADGGEYGQKRGCVDAQYAYDGDDEDEVEQYLDEAEHEGGERLLHVAAVEYGGGDGEEAADDELADVEHQYGYGQMYGEFDEARHHAVDQFVERQRFERLEILSGSGDGVGRESEGYLCEQ